MALSDSEKAERHRNRLLEKAREYSPDKYKNKYVAPLYQRMIRAEFGAVPSGLSIAVVDGELSHVSRCVGQCVCVTCGVVHAWNAGIKGMHTGHFVGSRRNSVLFEDGNVAPQCANCNYYLGGRTAGVSDVDGGRSRNRCDRAIAGVADSGGVVLA